MTEEPLSMRSIGTAAQIVLCGCSTQSHLDQLDIGSAQLVLVPPTICSVRTSCRQPTVHLSSLSVRYDRCKRLGSVGNSSSLKASQGRCFTACGHITADEIFSAAANLFDVSPITVQTIARLALDEREEVGCELRSLHAISSPLCSSILSFFHAL